MAFYFYTSLIILVEGPILAAVYSYVVLNKETPLRLNSQRGS